MLFLVVVPEIYLLSTLLLIIGVTCLGCSFTLLNSFLPLLVLNHPEAHASRRPDEGRRPSEQRKIDSLDLKLSTKISARGIAIGYAAAVAVEIVCIGVLIVSKKVFASPTLPLRLTIFITGAWWFCFSIVPLVNLKPRPGPPLPFGEPKTKLDFLRTSIPFAWRSLFRTLRLAISLRQVLRFLCAWFLLSDGVATLSATAILFARTELHMETVPIALLSITCTLSGIFGASIWPRIATRYQLTSKTVILCCIGLMECIPLYGLLGFLPFIQDLGWGGIQQGWEIFPMAFLLGTAMGGLNAFCRSFFGLLIPNGREAAFFALYAVTDKGSSAVGPAIVGHIIDKSGSIRPCFWMLAIMLLLPMPLIWSVDVDSGKRDAELVRRASIYTATTSLELEDVPGVGQEDVTAEESRGLMHDHE